ncbi:MAG: hypothetical protein C0418_01675 [Coriobacteriaceae bacterium]|nr:hypothetical protein [Coriobacteriaceae bacterium]
MLRRVLRRVCACCFLRWRRCEALPSNAAPTGRTDLPEGGCPHRRFPASPEIGDTRLPRNGEAPESEVLVQPLMPEPHSRAGPCNECTLTPAGLQSVACLVRGRTITRASGARLSAGADSPHRERPSGGRHPKRSSGTR